VIVERPALEGRVLQSLEAGRIPVVLGGCGIGRTSLLRRVHQQIGAERAQYLDLVACATTPERCLAAVTPHSPFRAAAPAADGIASAQAAFAALMGFFDRAEAAGRPATFLIDDWLEFRTFESFPGLRHVQRDVLVRLAASPNRFVLASRFTARAHRLLRDASARFEVVHAQPLDVVDMQAIALGRYRHGVDWSQTVAPVVTALSGGRMAYAVAMLDGLADTPSADPIDVVSRLLMPEGRLAALLRFSYEFRLHRARGYGALKAILGILAEDEPLTLTDIAQRLRRTPGSTKDYLSWLEDVDMLAVERKRYTFDDPLMRVFVRLHGGSTPPAIQDVRRELDASGRARMTAAAPAPVLAAPLPPEAAPAGQAENGRGSGIIEID
jgi:hypothetical protein